MPKLLIAALAGAVLLAGSAQAYTADEEERGRRACAFVAATAVGGDIVVRDVSDRLVLGVFFEVTPGFTAGGLDQTVVCKLVIKDGEPNLTGTVLNGEDVSLMQNADLHLALRAAYAADNDLPDYARE